MFTNPINGYGDKYKHRIEKNDVDLDKMKNAELVDYNEKYAMFKGGEYESIIVINKNQWKGLDSIHAWLSQ